MSGGAKKPPERAPCPAWLIPWKLTIGDGAYVGSGSVVTEDVSPDALAIARGRQVEKPGWAAAFREKNKK